MSFRSAVHMSSAYHRTNQYEPVGSYCDRASCDSPYHVAAYRFLCVNPHCTNPAHVMTDADIGQLQSTQDWLNEGRIDAVSTADDWHDTVNSYNQDAIDDEKYAALLDAADQMTTDELYDLLPRGDEAAS